MRTHQNQDRLAPARVHDFSRQVEQTNSKIVFFVALTIIAASKWRWGGGGGGLSRSPGQGCDSRAAADWQIVAVQASVAVVVAVLLE